MVESGSAPRTIKNPDPSRTDMAHTWLQLLDMIQTLSTAFLLGGTWSLRSLNMIDGGPRNNGKTQMLGKRRLAPRVYSSLPRTLSPLYFKSVQEATSLRFTILYRIHHQSLGSFLDEYT